MIASTILGALATVEIIKLVLYKHNEASMPSHNFKLCLPSLSGSNPAYTLERTKPTVPLLMESIALEVTRGVPLRCIPDEFTAWSQIALPRGSELHILGAFINYMQVSPVAFYLKHTTTSTVLIIFIYRQIKHSVVIQALMHSNRRMITLDGSKAQEESMPIRFVCNLFRLNQIVSIFCCDFGQAFLISVAELKKQRSC